MSVNFNVVPKYATGLLFLPVEDMPENVCWVVSAQYKSLPAGYDNDPAITVKPALSRLIRSLAVEHPTWSFYGKNMRPIETFEVYCGSEYLGRLGYMSGKYNVSSPKIDGQLIRKDHKSVKSEAAAYKLAQTLMPKSIEEHMAQTTSSLNSALSSLASDHKYAAKCAVDKLFYVFDQFVRKSPDEAKRIFAESGADVTLVDTALEKIGVHEATLRAMNASLCNYIDVLLRNDMYIVTNSYRIENNKFIAPIKPYWSTKNSDALEPIVRRHLGLLKLAENGTLIDGVGFRFSETEFRIFI